MPHATAALLREELTRFVAGDPGRSVAIEVLGAPRMRTDVAGDVARPAASLIKLLPAVALYQEAAQGRFDLETTRTTWRPGSHAYPTALAAFTPDRLLTLRELCAFSLLTSDNSAAEYLRDLVGAGAVEAVRAELGLTHTKLVVGFSDDALAGNRANRTTAREVLRVLVHLDGTPGLSDLRRFLINNIRNNRLPARLDDDVPVLHKTGSLETVCHDAGIIYGRTHKIDVAYLCEDQTDVLRTSVEIADSGLRVLGLLNLA